MWFDLENAHLEADELLVATGRTARTKDIGLETVRIQPGEWLEMDDTCRVKQVESGWLYAAGDGRRAIDRGRL
jgi:pyruvate/2-oxoglutarate dehydrogenase complex dihydrolipoamide dehydrogenase (E3) component